MILPTLTRDQVTASYSCTHAELGRLLRDKQAPLPVRMDGQVLWYADEVAAAFERVKRILTKRRRLAKQF